MSRTVQRPVGRIKHMPAFPFSPAEIREIAGRASTIDERRAGVCVVDAPADDLERQQARNRLVAWRQSAAAGDHALFIRRLAADGLSEQTALSLLGRARLAQGQILPAWARCFAWAASMMAAPDAPPP